MQFSILNKIKWHLFEKVFLVGGCLKYFARINMTVMPINVAQAPAAIVLFSIFPK